MDDSFRDLLGALKSLGYPSGEAKVMAQSAIDYAGDDAPLDKLVRAALRKSDEDEEEPEGIEDEEAWARDFTEEVEESMDEEEAQEPAAGAVVCGDGYEVVSEVLDAPEVEERRISIPKVVVPMPRHPAKSGRSHFHWAYFLLLGWWLTLALLPVRIVLLGIDTLFARETRRPPSLSSFFGWW